MRRTFAILLVGICVVAWIAAVAKDQGDAKPFPLDENGKIRFQGVVQVEGIPASELHARAKFWAAKIFTSARSVIQLDDPERGLLVCKGAHEESYGWSENVWFDFTLTVESKDGRFRWTIDQCAEHGGGFAMERLLTKDHVGQTGRKAVYERFRAAMVALGVNLESAMKQTPGAAKGGDF